MAVITIMSRTALNLSSHFQETLRVNAMAIGKESSQPLVTECSECKKEFANDNDYKLHLSECHIKENFPCPKCDKIFGHQKILQFHIRVHDYRSQRTKLEHQISKNIRENNKEQKDCSNDNKNEKPSFISHHTTSRKQVGLTKIRLEDCLRCDECSCMYLDENDYMKHMRNFHRKDSPRKQRQKKGCRSCCKYCNCQGSHTHNIVQKERGNNNLFHYNIKDRWSKMVSRRLCSSEREEVNVKPDPDYDPEQSCPDYSDLLSQVEVKIKTEPPDDSSQYEGCNDICT